LHYASGWDIERKEKWIMAISRRSLIAGTITLAGTSGLLRAASAFTRDGQGAGPFTFHALPGGNAAIATQERSKMTKEQLIRTYYSGYEKNEWSLIDSVISDSFTFTSPNDDDHISKSAFKARCWPQAEFVERFELENVFEKDTEAFVRYLCRTTKGTSFRNVEYFRFAGGMINSIECYFGGRLGYPTATISGKP
jgi:SnoaL-like protein